MKKGIIISIFAIVVIGVLLIIIATNTTVKSSDRAVSQFYTDWINGKYSLSDDSYMHADILSETAIKNINSIVSSISSGGYDPIVCSQDMPSSVEVFPIVNEEQTAEVSVRETFEAIVKDIKVSLVKENSLWKITNIACGDIPKQEVVTSFEKEGNVVEKNDEWVLVYEEPGKPALSVILDFSNWRCADTDRCVPSFKQGGRVKVIGKKISENSVLVDSIVEL